MAAKPNIMDPMSLKSPGFSSLLNSGATYGLASLGLRGSPEICSSSWILNTFLSQDWKACVERLWSGPPSGAETRPSILVLYYCMKLDYLCTYRCSMIDYVRKLTASTSLQRLSLLVSIVLVICQSPVTNEALPDQGSDPTADKRLRQDPTPIGEAQYLRLRKSFRFDGLLCVTSWQTMWGLTMGSHYPREPMVEPDWNIQSKSLRENKDNNLSTRKAKPLLGPLHTNWTEYGSCIPLGLKRLHKGQLLAGMKSVDN